MPANNRLDLLPGDLQWSQQDKDLYEKLPYHLARNQVKQIKRFARFTKLFGKQAWTPRSGTILKTVRKERAPQLRSQILPRTIQQSALVDKVELAEMTETAQLYHHKVESHLITFHPDFQDFLECITEVNDNLAEQITHIPEVFARTFAFHASPRVALCGQTGSNFIEDVPHFVTETMALSKTAAVLQNLCAQVSRGLSLRMVNYLLQVAFNDLRMVPYQGDLLGDGTDGKFLAQKYALLISNEVWSNWTFDPFLRDNKEDNRNIVTEGFRGSLFGQVVTMIEDKELRIAADGTVPAPDIEQDGDRAEIANKGETVANPAYVAAPWAVAWLVGLDAGYKMIKPGPPPSHFTKGGMDMSKFNAMDWNGKVRETRDFMVPVLNTAGETVLDTNKYGEYMQMISHIAFGCIPTQRRNLLPIIYARTRVNPLS